MGQADLAVRLQEGTSVYLIANLASAARDRKQANEVIGAAGSSATINAALDKALALGRTKIRLAKSTTPYGGGAAGATWMPTTIPDGLEIFGSSPEDVAFAAPTSITVPGSFPAGLTNPGYNTAVILSGRRVQVSGVNAGSVNRGDRQLTWSGDRTANVRAGDRIALLSSDIFNAARPDQFKKGEILQVGNDGDTTAGAAVTFNGTNTVIILSQPLEDSYVYLPTLWVYTMPKRVKVYGIDWQGAAASTDRYSLLLMQYIDQPYFDGTVDGKVTATHGVRMVECVDIYQAHSASYLDVADSNNPSGPEGYGIHVVGCKGGKIDHPYGHRCRHTWDVTGFGQRPPSRDVIVDEPYAIRNWAAGHSTHGGAERTVVVNPVADHCGGGMINRARGTKILGTLRVFGTHADAGPYPTHQSTLAPLYIGEGAGTGASMAFSVNGSDGTLITFASPADFVPVDVGRTVVLRGAKIGGGDLETTISSIVGASTPGNPCRTIHVATAAVTGFVSSTPGKLPYSGIAGMDLVVENLDADPKTSSAQSVHGIVADESLIRARFMGGKIRAFKGASQYAIYARGQTIDDVHITDYNIDATDADPTTAYVIRYSPAYADPNFPLQPRDLEVDGVTVRNLPVSVTTLGIIGVSGGPSVGLPFLGLDVHDCRVQSVSGAGVAGNPFVRLLPGYHDVVYVRQNRLPVLTKATIVNSALATAVVHVAAHDNVCSDGVDLALA